MSPEANLPPIARRASSKAGRNVAFSGEEGLSRFSIDSVSMAEVSDGGGSNPSTPSLPRPGNTNLLSQATDTFTKQETKAVNSVKTVVYLILLLSAIGFAVATFFLVEQEQSSSYKADFYSIGDMVAMDLQLKIRNMVTQLQTTSSSITSMMIQEDSNSNKFMTLAQFDRRMQDYGNNATMIFYAPLVLAAQQPAWINYTKYHQDWIDVALQSRGWTTGSSSPLDNPIPDTITSQATDPSQYAPIWQMSPPPMDRSIINQDLLGMVSIGAVLDRLSSSKAEMGNSQGITNLLAYSPEYNALTQDIIMTHPTSILAVPVYPDFDSQQIVGYMVALFQFSTLLQEYRLQDGEGPVTIDISQSCGPGMSYMVEKSNVVYLGESPAAKSDLEVEYPLFQASCDYQIKVSSSDIFETNYQDSAPIVSAVLVFVLFLFIMSVFFMYDCIVQRRQKKLLVTAQRTNAVVSSLFPEDVQRRIMQEAEAQEKKEQRMTVTNKMKEFLQDTTQPQSKSDKATELRGKPIADFFPEATVMFADLVGFTAWSSMREPTQVFTLLESIYNAFDEIARRRRVFKVETVGDCYVAVSGLPDPCVDHALVMARFASDCRIRMNDLVKELEVSLGPDTTELAMRFGLHSGPVTAGVLRGDKARFQLFGDTINTTSRIESTGKRDRIHISQETADYLIKAGKQHWLKLREDKVTAKGKLKEYHVFAGNQGLH